MLEIKLTRFLSEKAILELLMGASVPPSVDYEVENMVIDAQIKECEEEANDQLQEILRQIMAELVDIFPFIWQGTNSKPWQTFCQKWIGE